MAAADTGNVAPPDFAGRRTNISTAYQNALNQLNLQQSQLYNQMGYKASGAVDPATGLPTAGNLDLDTTNQFGSIQQLLHQTGQSLSADDMSEEHRGLGLDSGLAAQRQRLIQYAAAAQKNNLGQAFQSQLAGIGNSGQGALQTYNQDNTQNNSEESQFVAQNASIQAQAQANQRLLDNQQAQLVNQGSPTQVPTTLGNFQGRAATGTGYYAPLPAVTKATGKPGKVTPPQTSRNAL